jgi:hypothetical protein
MTDEENPNLLGLKKKRQFAFASYYVLEVTENGNNELSLHSCLKKHFKKEFHHTVNQYLNYIRPYIALEEGPRVRAIKNLRIPTPSSLANNLRSDSDMLSHFEIGRQRFPSIPLKLRCLLFLELDHKISCLSLETYFQLQLPQ